MRPKLAIVLALLVIIPVGLMLWFGGRLARAEAAGAEAEIRSLAGDGLGEMAELVGRRVDRLGRELQGELAGLLAVGGDVGVWRRKLRGMRFVSAGFLRDGEGRWVYPGAEPTAGEVAFMERSAAIWGSGLGPAGGEGKPLPEEGWHTWFWNRGLHFILWRRDLASGLTAGFEVDRPALLAAIVAELPDSPSRGRGAGLARYTELLDGSGETLYGWGEPSGEGGRRVLASGVLPAPLGRWRLRISGAGVPGEGYGGRLSLLASGGAVAGLLSLLAVYLYRGQSQQMREARQRVSFVNQVSHELKTPLTNIRMYAELLEERIPEEEEEGRRFVRVVVDESRRLSRLINNVLAFARGRRGRLEIHPRPCVPDEVVGATLGYFGPALAACGVEVGFRGGAAREVGGVDPDALGQILGNLIGNVEKYAAGGGALDVRSALVGGVLEVRVRDWGPGISEGDAARVFEDFARLDDRVSEGAAGTGIGLPIARQLARLHGGDLTLEGGAGEGACFLLRIPVREVGVGG